VNDRSQALNPGTTVEGTVFRATATYKEKTYRARSATWLGRVKATSRPSLQGQIRIGQLVRPMAATWQGGWQAVSGYHAQPDGQSAGREPGFEALSVEACRTSSGQQCINLTPQGNPVFAKSPVRVTRRFIGWYLFAFDQHFAADTAFAGVGYSSPADIPPLKVGQTVARSKPEGPVQS
jgi:hypothetical protein